MDFVTFNKYLKLLKNKKVNNLTMNKKLISMAPALDNDVEDPANLFESLFKKDLA